jgi:hypothetical protein
MATKKTKKTAKVRLDAATVHKFESHLRDGLVASGAVIATEYKTPTLKGPAKVELDPETTTRLAKTLQGGLVASGAVIATEYPQAKAAKRKAKAKGRSPRPSSKKR